jgi:hypothetical protein
MYIQDGISKEVAINMVKAQTALSPKYWQMVLEAVN